MVLLLSEVLTVTSIASLRKELREQSASGANQLGGAREQLEAHARIVPLSQAQRTSLVRALTSHPLFTLGAQPAQLSGLRCVLQEGSLVRAGSLADEPPGTAAAAHPSAGDRAAGAASDDPVRERGHWSGSGAFRGERVRRDLAITIFLSDPESYEGGELWVDTGYGEEPYKPAAGSAVVAPSSALQRMGQVTRGSSWTIELAAQSLVREAGQREILYEVGCSLELLDLLGAAFGTDRCAELESLRRVHRNLLQLWAQH